MDMAERIDRTNERMATGEVRPQGRNGMNEPATEGPWWRRPAPRPRVCASCHKGEHGRCWRGPVAGGAPVWTCDCSTAGHTRAYERQHPRAYHPELAA